MRVNDVTLYLRPNSFFQTNTQVAAALYAQARDWVGRVAPASLWDLYCGVGGFALHCAGQHDGVRRDVVGIEVSEQAVRSAQVAADNLRRAPTPSSARSPSGSATRPSRGPAPALSSSSSTLPAAASARTSQPGSTPPACGTSSTRAATSRPWPPTSPGCPPSRLAGPGSSTCSPRPTTTRSWSCSNGLEPTTRSSPTSAGPVIIQNVQFGFHNVD